MRKKNNVHVFFYYRYYYLKNITWDICFFKNSYPHAFTDYRSCSIKKKKVSSKKFFSSAESIKKQTKKIFCGTLAIFSSCIAVKIIRIRYNCTQFCSYHCVKKFKNFEQHRNFLSDIHQNVIGTKLCIVVTEYKVSTISMH